MAMFTKNIIIDNVHRVKRPGIGYVYNGRISIADLAHGLLEGDIKYAPKYQRGLKPSDDNAFDAATLLHISDDDLLIDVKRAQAIAVKYLMAVSGDPNRALYNPEIIWNARKNEHYPPPEYDPDARRLTIHTNLSIPDSAHRHFAYYTLYRWKLDPDSVPEQVVIAEDGEEIDNGDIIEWLQLFEPDNAEESSILVYVFNVTKDREGKLFDEYNVEGKKPSTSASIDMYSDKTASRRFVSALMKKSSIFDGGEIETRANTIGSASRKITTVATLDVAIKPFNPQLLVLEKTAEGKYRSLVEFFDAYYTEWAMQYTEFAPTASGATRQALRKTSFAMSNIMFFPMFRLAFNLWDKYDKANVDWRSENEWKDGLARLAGDVEIGDPDDETKTVRVPLMARDSDESVGNPAWQGKILVQKFDSSGKPTGWSLSSTRQTRDAAYHYLVEQSGVALPAKRPRGS